MYTSLPVLTPAPWSLAPLESAAGADWIGGAEAFPRGMFVLLALLALISLGLSASVFSRERRVLGAVRIRHRAPSGWRWIVALLLIAALAYRAWSSSGVSAPGFEIGVGLLCLIALWLAPLEGDRLLGARGVRAGYQVRAFEVLEEWRLSGDHLRFRMQGEWTAVPVPAEEHANLRTELEGQAKDRESRFKI